MRPLTIRLGVLAAAAAIIAGCDTRLPTQSFKGSDSTAAGKDTKKPTIQVDSPLVNALVNLGDSILVTLKLHDDQGLGNVQISGLSVKGSAELGTLEQTVRYSAVNVPVAGNFRTGLKDTTVRRYLKPINAADTTLDSLVIRVIATDALGNVDTARTRVDIVAGPRVAITSPVLGDSIPAGVGVSVTARATHADGIRSVTIHAVGESNWPTKFDTTITQSYPDGPREAVLTRIVRIPIDAPIRGKVTISVSAIDVNGQPGSSAPVLVFVRSASSAIPRVTQVVDIRSEITDSITIRATGEGIARVGFVLRDAAGNTIKDSSVALPQPLAANVQVGMALNLPLNMQGARIKVTAYAIDQAGRKGFAVSAGQTAGAGSLVAALADSTLIVHGRTFAIPRATATSVIADVSVDAPRGHVFLSNIQFNLLELWDGATKAFDPTGIAVGSFPWGMSTSVNAAHDTLFVANSGGTNISRVFIGSAARSDLRELLDLRIKTRNTYVFVVTETRDVTTGQVHLSAEGPISYSDRPQYVAQSAGGRIFYSTRPTSAAPAGTIRWLDPTLPVPDPRQVWQYGNHIPGTVTSYALFNIDSIALFTAVPGTLHSDQIVIWDHPYGQASGVIQAQDSLVRRAMSKLRGDSTTNLCLVGPPPPGMSDSECVGALDVASLGLTDTTFVAAAGSRNWIAFGEGNTATRAGRVMMMADSIPASFPTFFSPLVTVSDLTDNAAERVFGIALDATGRTVASHGTQSFFADVADPFHLRLQGKFDSIDNGAGIAFHPLADGQHPANAANRLAFVATSTGVIELVDISYYIQRGRLQLKNNVYGPLRASMPFPTDPPEVVLKLFAMTLQGLVVIDLTAQDIKPGP